MFVRYSKIWSSRFIFHINCSSISIRGQQKFRIDRPIVLAHPTHSSFCNIVISGAPFRAISAWTMRYVQKRIANSLKKITRQTTSFIGQIFRSFIERFFVLSLFLFIPPKDTARRVYSGLYRRQQGRSLSMEYGRITRMNNSQASDKEDWQKLFKSLNFSSLGKSYNKEVYVQSDVNLS